MQLSHNITFVRRRRSLPLVFAVLVALACIQAESHADGYTGPALVGWFDDGTCYAPVHVGFLFFALTSEDFVGGAQTVAAGVNTVGNDFKGLFQMTGPGCNRVRRDFYGVAQLAFGANIVDGRFTGLCQLGIVNVADEVRGLQLGLVNKACILRGVQIGLINLVSDNALPFCPIVNIGF